MDTNNMISALNLFKNGY